MIKHRERWNDLLFGVSSHSDDTIPSSPFASCILKYLSPHGYGNLSEFDIILPAENRFLGAGEGALVESGGRSVFT
jgi:hypothetical protein